MRQKVSKLVFHQHMQLYVERNKPIFIKLVLLVLFFLLLQFNQLEFIADWLDMTSLYHHNQSYLTKIQVLATTDMVNFTELLSVTEIARSSTVGISFFASFNVDIGNVLHSFSIILEKGVEVQLTSLAAIEILMLLDDFAYWVGPFLFKLMILASIIYYLTQLVFMPKSISLKVYRVGEMMIVLFLLGHIALPYSIHISSLVSQVLTQEKRNNISSALQHTHDELTIIKKNASFKDHAESSLQYLKSISRKNITHKVSSVSKHVFTSIALNVFDLLIMPGLLLFILYKACLRLIPINKIYSDVDGVISVINEDRVKIKKIIEPMISDNEKKAVVKREEETLRDVPKPVKPLTKKAIIRI